MSISKNLDDLIREQTEEFASNPENSGAIFQMAKNQKAEVESKIEEQQSAYERETADLRRAMEDELFSSKPNDIDKLEEKIRHASHMSVALRHYWLSFLVFAVLFVGSLIIIHDSIPKANPLSDWLPYLIVIVAPFILAGIYSAIVRKIWNNKCYQLKRSNEMRDWENLQKQIKRKYEPQMDAIYDAKYRDTISDLNNELEKKIKFYENARQVYLQYKFKGTVFVYFESMKHGWTQDWCACGVYIDGNQVYYTQNEQLFFVKLNPGYHSVQIKMSAKLSDGISSYTYSYQLSPEDCPAFLVFNKFDLYGDIRQVDYKEFEEITNKPLVK